MRPSLQKTRISYAQLAGVHKLDAQEDAQEVVASL
jgi:hypothetical protein